MRFSNGKLYVSVNPFSYVGLSQLLRYDWGQRLVKQGRGLRVVVVPGRFCAGEGWHGGG